VDGDVHAGVAERLARRGETARVAELGEDRDRRQRPDAVVAHQRPAAGLALGVVAQLRSSGASWASCASISANPTVICSRAAAGSEARLGLGSRRNPLGSEALMAVIVFQQVVATEEEYRAVNDAMDTRANPPAGLIIHTGGPVGDGEVRVIDVWDSTEAFQAFAAERLGPTIAQVMGADAPTPSVEIHELYDVIKGTS
jgi:hypothetical protein